MLKSMRIQPIFAGLSFLAGVLLLVLSSWGDRLQVSLYGSQFTQIESLAIHISLHQTIVWVVAVILLATSLWFLVFGVLGAPYNRRSLGVFSAMVILFPASFIIILLAMIFPNAFKFHEMTSMRDFGLLHSTLILAGIIGVLALVFTLYPSS